MAVSTKPRRQISFDEVKFIEDGDLLALLEDRAELAGKKKLASDEYKTIHEKAKAKILTLNPEQPVRCGRWVLQVKTGKARTVKFTTTPKPRVSIKTVEEASQDGPDDGEAH